jgi:hypothetical protein
MLIETESSFVLHSESCFLVQDLILMKVATAVCRFQTHPPASDAEVKMRTTSHSLTGMKIRHRYIRFILH